MPLLLPLPGLPASADKPAPAAKGAPGGKAQKKVGAEKGKDKSVGGGAELINAAWQPLLAEVGDTPKARLTAMLEAMQVRCPRRWARWAGAAGVAAAVEGCCC